MQYIERPRAIEARLVGSDSAVDIASWCGGMVMPDGAILYRVGEVWLQAPSGSYLTLVAAQFSHVSATEFEAAWVSAE